MPKGFFHRNFVGLGNVSMSPTAMLAWCFTIALSSTSMARGGRMSSESTKATYGVSAMSSARFRAAPGPLFSCCTAVTFACSAANCLASRSEPSVLPSSTRMTWHCAKTVCAAIDASVSGR